MIGWLLGRLGGAAGPRVRTEGRAGLVYTEGERRMRVEAEMLTDGAYDWAIYTDSIQRWEPPFQHEPLTPEVKQRIISAIRAELGARADLVERPVIEPWVPEGSAVQVIGGRTVVTLPEERA